MRRTTTVAALLASLAVAMTAGPAAADTTVSALMVSVAGPPMMELIPAFEKSHAGVHVQPVFGGSQNIAAQLATGAPADMLVGGPSTMGPVSAKLGPAVPLLSFRMAVIVPKGSTKVRGLRDLAKPGLRLVLGSPGSPQARFAHTVLSKAEAKYGADFERKVMANVVTTKSAESQIVATMKNGAADAAVGFTSDATDTLDALPVPPEDDLVTTVSVALVTGAAHTAAAQSFIDYLRSADAQAILRKYHFEVAR
ncbi:MAG: molybdate ABC transporter substrate-binding protein [Candidatus Eremiobacteraeota bacterium]|nr:molybdate ABC transporter substrate-binding protein [Candidatus Eremiobacteraeota bacterium]